MKTNIYLTVEFAAENLVTFYAYCFRLQRVYLNTLSEFPNHKHRGLGLNKES